VPVVKKTILLVALLVALLAFAPAAGAATAPSATTGPVTAVSSTSATLTGSVNPNGTATSWYFEYGTTGYDIKTSSKSSGSGTSSSGVSAAITGLTAGTTYHYRLVATSSAGTTRGVDGIFATTPAPVATTGAASAVTLTSATVAGTVDPNGHATSWYFEYGTSTSYGTKTAAKSAGGGTNPVAVSAPLTGLKPGRTFHYRLVVTSDAGTGHGGDATFSTTGAPTATTGSVNSISLTSAKLTGSVVPNGLATSWYFEYGTGTTYGIKTAAKSAGSGTARTNVSASLSGLKPGTTYHYRLVAINSAGTTAGRDRAFSTQGAPVARTGTAQDVTGFSAKANGTVDAGGRRTTWYVEYGPSTFYGLKTASRSGGSSFGAKAVSASISGLRPSVTYHYRLVAVNDQGTSRGADATFTTVGVTVSAAVSTTTFGQSVLLSGAVPLKKQGEAVQIFAQEYGKGSPRLLATVATDASGFWSFPVAPRILTSYLASWQGGMSSAAVVGVRPAISLRRVSARRFATRVAGDHAFARRTVKLQRLTAHGWVNVKRVRLDRRGAATFRAALPRGRSTLRIAMSVNQAGAGYLGAFSRTIVVTRA
jgi:phosphodiesterase/alkaline phosphatase D-like protein